MHKWSGKWVHLGFTPNNKQYYAIITEAHKKDKEEEEFFFFFWKQEGEEIKNLIIQIFQ